MVKDLCQVLSILTMERPFSFSAEDIRDEKTKVLRYIGPISKEHVLLGQYIGNGKGTHLVIWLHFFLALEQFKTQANRDIWRIIQYQRTLSAQPSQRSSSTSILPVGKVYHLFSKQAKVMICFSLQIRRY